MSKELITPEGRQLIASKLKLVVTENGFTTAGGATLTDEDVLRTLADAAHHSTEVEATLDLLITKLNRNPMGNLIDAVGIFIRTFDGLWSDFKKIREKLGLKHEKFC